MEENKFSILFICLGNICRSPLAHGIFQDLVHSKGYSDQFLIDSCGTGAWHIGEPPHKDSQRVAKERGISLEGQRGRQLIPEDGEKFNLFVCMDRSNERDTRRILPPNSRIVLLREYDPIPDEMDVPDPYFGTGDGFTVVYEVIERSCKELLQKLEEELSFK